MASSYYDLFDLLEQDIEAEEFYAELPEYIREMIEDRADSIRSTEDLQSYADNLLSGDK